MNGKELTCLSVGLGMGYAVAQLLKQHGGKQPAKSADKVCEDPTGLLRIIRKNVQELAPYRCARDDYNEGVLLDANENGFGPPLPNEGPDYEPLLQMKLERYPCPYQRELKGLIGSYRNVATDRIFLGVGSDEAIDLLIRICCVPGKDSILITPPTYGMYKVSAKTNDVEIIETTLTADLQLLPEEILNAVTEQTKIAFFCSPGNPTAVSLKWKDIQTVLESDKFRGIVVVDEAYVDFSSQESLCAKLEQYPRLVVLQTLSKGFGLAGIRLGMAIGHPILIQMLNNVKAPYNINKLTSATAVKAFKNIPLFEENIRKTLEERQIVINSLQSDEFPTVRKVFPTDSNFILFQIDDALQVYKDLADNRGVVIRYRGNLPLLKDCLRATVGTPEENKEFLKQLKSSIANLK